jgi:GTP cyclohydrolase I
MHHLLPFHGVAYVAYLPAEPILGISKLARVVEHFARGRRLDGDLGVAPAGARRSAHPQGISQFDRRP